MLHTVNKSPFEKTTLTTCLRLSKSGSAILLLEDGVYGAMAGTPFEKALSEALQNREVYALQPDLEARGMATDKVISGIQLVDYSGFVDLVADKGPVQAWL